jgi:hypothetical protein
VGSLGSKGGDGEGAAKSEEGEWLRSDPEIPSTTPLVSPCFLLRMSYNRSQLRLSAEVLPWVALLCFLPVSPSPCQILFTIR